MSGGEFLNFLMCVKPPAACLSHACFWVLYSKEDLPLLIQYLHVRAHALSFSDFSFVVFSSGGECGGAFLRREEIASPPQHAVRRLHPFVFVARPSGDSSPVSCHAVAAPPDCVLARSRGEGLLALPGAMSFGALFGLLGTTVARLARHVPVMCSCERIRP